MQFGEDSLHEYLKTRFFVPAWWVNAFDSMFQAEYATRSWQQIPMLGVGPAYDLQELYLFPLVISHIQRGILDPKSTEKVKLDLAKIEKEAGIHLSSRKKYLKQLLASLGSIKLYHKCSFGFDVQSLFCSESWLSNGEGMDLALGLNSAAGELFTGFISAYKEAKRSLERRFRLRHIVGDKPPLVVWRSLWHEAQGSEQLVLLRMEQAVQWLFKCLNLDGVFGESFQNLFHGIRDQANQGQPYSLTKMVSITHRLSKKLAEHGSLSKPIEGDYLAFDEREPLLQLLWKVSSSHFQADDFRAFGKACFDKFERDESFLSDIHGTLLGLAGGRELKADIKKHYEKILGSQNLLHQSTKEDRRGHLLIDQNVILPLVGLYWEWVVRKDEKHPLQLPDELRHTELLGDLPDLSVDQAKHTEHFWRFCSQISEKDLYKEVINKTPGGSLTSLESAAMLDKIALRELTPLKVQPIKTGDMVKSEIKSEKKVKLSSSPKVTESGAQTSKTSSIPTKKYEKRAGVDLASAKEDVVEVLNRMKKNSRENYLKLTKLYLESLDQGARQLSLEIKNRMQPQVFEQHSHHRLVRFMIERPFVWQNLSNS